MPSRTRTSAGLPVQWVSAPPHNKRRRYTGRLAAGTLLGRGQVVSPACRYRSTVTALDTLDDDRTTGVAPLSVSMGWPTTSTSGAVTCSSAPPSTQYYRSWPREVDAGVLVQRDPAASG